MSRSVKTYFDNKPLRDATSPLTIPVLGIDDAAARAVKSGDVNDPGRFANCVLAKACNRVFGDEARVRIARSTAYVSLPNEKFAYRFWLSQEAREILTAFDLSREIEGIGTMVTFEVPPAGKSLARMRKYAKRWKAKHPEHRGGDSPRKTTRKQTKTDPLHGVVRNGVYVKL